MITLQQNTEKKLKNYANNFDGNYNKMFDNILEQRIIQLQKAIKNLNTDFIFFENKYSMKTNEFYQLFEEGKLGDANNDFYQWSGEYEVFLKYQTELKSLL
jgi:hypothetical protein